MSTLPVELIRRVVEDSIEGANDYHYLPVLSLSCHQLRHEAQRILFRDTGELHTTPAAYKKTGLFLDTMVSSPDRLALYVKTFSITFNGWFHPDPDETTNFINKLSSTLQVMRGLKSLEVINWKVGNRSLPRILEGVRFKLTSFCWYGFLDAAFDASDVASNFLRHQDDIKHLEMSGFINKGALKSIGANALPHLRSLSAPFSMSEVILPGKQCISSLVWTLPFSSNGEHLTLENRDDIPFNLDVISKELGKVRYLSYITYPSFKLSFIAPYITSLVCLDTHRGDIRVKPLSQLPCLKILILNAGTSDIFPEEDEMIMVAAACESLEHIDIEDDYGTFSRFRYDRSTKTFRIYRMEESDRIVWPKLFDIFDD